MKFLFFLLTLGSVITVTAQNKPSPVPNQLQKGKWVIATNLVEMGPYKNETNVYDANGNITRKEKQNNFHASFLLTAQDWGYIGYSNGNNSGYNTNGSQQNTEKNNGFGLRLMPSAGYFIKDKLMLGVQLDISFNNSKNTNNSNNSSSELTNKASGIGLGPELRYYFGNLKAKNLFHAGVAFIAGVGTHTRDSKLTQNNILETFYWKTKNSYFKLTPYVGYTKVLGKRWILEPVIYSRIRHITIKGEYKRTYNNNTLTGKESNKYKYTQYAGLALRVSYTL